MLENVPAYAVGNDKAGSKVFGAQAENIISRGIVTDTLRLFHNYWTVPQT